MLYLQKPFWALAVSACCGASRKNGGTFFHSKNLNPCSTASPGAALIAPSTRSPRSSFLFSLASIVRSTPAATIDMAAMRQLCMNAASYCGAAFFGYR